MPADIPAPGQSMPADIPAPGEVAPDPVPVYEEPAAAPMYAEPEAAAQPAALSADGDIYTGGAAFDPSDGLIMDDLGGVPTKSGTGLALTALAGGILIGALLGFFGNEVTSKNSMKNNATAKAQKMIAEVKRVQETRTEINLKFEDIAKKIATDPTAGSAELTDLLLASFGPDANFPKVESLFGWQMASLHPASVKKAFSLYKASNDLVVDMGYFAQYVNANAAAIGGRGPKTFAVVTKDGVGKAAIMVEYVSAVCGQTEPEAEGEEPKAIPCESGKEGDATAYMIREAPGGKTVAVPREIASILVPKGAMYQYAIGDHPEQNAANQYQAQAQRVQDRLDAMAKYEKATLKALDAYSENPTTDDDSAQSDPGE